MKALLSWLREFAPLEADPKTIGDALGALGTPVEEMLRIGHGLDGITFPDPKPDALADLSLKLVRDDVPVKGRVLGVVLNRVNPRRDGDYYYDHYRYNNAYYGSNGGR